MLEKKKKEYARNSLVGQWLERGYFTVEVLGSNPVWGTKIPQVTLRGQNKKQTKRIYTLWVFGAELLLLSRWVVSDSLQPHESLASLSIAIS